MACFPHSVFDGNVRKFSVGLLYVRHCKIYPGIFPRASKAGAGDLSDIDGTGVQSKRVSGRQIFMPAGIRSSAQIFFEDLCASAGWAEADTDRNHLCFPPGHLQAA